MSQIDEVSKITGKEYPLRKIFSSDFEYYIPAYQRPYAWTEAETGTLFDDLYDFYQTETNDNYFLGSVVLIKNENDRHSDVIDGQQRITTLSILFSALSTVFKAENRKSDCKKYLQESGSEVEGVEPQPRLFLRDKDQSFFNKYIQEVNLEELLSIDQAKLDTEAKKHIQSNCKVLIDRLTDSFKDDEALLGFTKFLLNRCYLVVVYTPNKDSAFRVFSVMNSRGLDLLPTDIIKSETIGKLEDSEQEKYTQIWEELENQTGREGFNEVFTHTRTIFAKERPKKNLLEEFREYVSKVVEPKKLIDDYLVPYTNAYYQIKNKLFSSTENADEINRYLAWLNKTNNYDWMPPAIEFFTKHQNDSSYILWFVRKLERLASFMLVTAQDVNQRMDRYKWVLVEIDNGTDTLDNPIKNIELTEWEKEQFKKALDGDVYLMPSIRRNFIIQRLDSFVSDGGASYDSKIFTIEHVLPQNPAADSKWMQDWSETKHKLWLNRIANLVPLTRQRNSAAQNYDFDTKKTKYFLSKSGTSSYSLTTQVINQASWTPEIVEQRQSDLMEKFIEKWDLKETDTVVYETEYMLAGRGGNAKGFPLADDKFVVRKGSKISEVVTDSFQPAYAEQRKQLIEEGVIKDGEFTCDYEFNSPSTAAIIILGRSANGRREWRLLDGRSLGRS